VQTGLILHIHRTTRGNGVEQQCFPTLLLEAQDWQDLQVSTRHNKVC